MVEIYYHLPVATIPIIALVLVVIILHPLSESYPELRKTNFVLSATIALLTVYLFLELLGGLWTA